MLKNTHRIDKKKIKICLLKMFAEATKITKFIKRAVSICQQIAKTRQLLFVY